MEEDFSLATPQDEQQAKEVVQQIMGRAPVSPEVLTTGVCDILAGRALIDHNFADALLDQQNSINGLPIPELYTCAKACMASYMLREGLAFPSEEMEQKYRSCFEGKDGLGVYNLLSIRVSMDKDLATVLKDEDLSAVLPDASFVPSFEASIDKCLNTEMSIEERYAALMVKYKTLERDYKNLYTQFQELYAQNQELFSQNKELFAQNKELFAQNEQMRTRQDQLESEVDSIKDMLKSKQAQTDEPVVSKIRQELTDTKQEMRQMEEDYPDIDFANLDTFEIRRAKIDLIDLDKTPAEDDPERYETIFRQMMKRHILENQDNPRYKGYAFSAAIDLYRNGFPVEGIKTLINRCAPQACNMAENVYAEYVVRSITANTKQQNYTH